MRNFERIRKMAINRYTAFNNPFWAVRLTLLLLLFQVSYVRGTFCPITSFRWRQPNGVLGAIVDSDRYNYQLATIPSIHFPDGCSQICRSYPNKQCAHWTWNGKSDCYLYQCGVCSSGSSFDPNVKYGSSPYASGGGPAMDNCDLPGVKGDPHFTGAGNMHFDFSGHPNRYYSLISDASLHINAYFGGRNEIWQDKNKSLTWIREVGILWENHVVQFTARSGERWQYDQGYMESIEADGARVLLDRPGDSARVFDDMVSVRWVSGGELDADDRVDIYEVYIPEVLNLRMIVRPEVEKLRTPSDGVVHFTLQFRSIELSEDAHGIIGQTFRVDHQNRILGQQLEFNKNLGVVSVKGENAEGFLDGKVEDYQVSGIFTTDCTYCRFQLTSNSVRGSKKDLHGFSEDVVTTALV